MGSLESLACIVGRCIAGRWLSVDDAERRIGSAGPALMAVFKEVLDKKKRKREHDTAAGGEGSRDDVVDELGIEECAAHSIKVGRWSKEALQAMSDPLFWYSGRKASCLLSLSFRLAAITPR